MSMWLLFGAGILFDIVFIIGCVYAKHRAARREKWRKFVLDVEQEIESVKKQLAEDAGRMLKATNLTSAELHELTEKVAYTIWEKKGRPNGQDKENWADAVQLIRERRAT